MVRTTTASSLHSTRWDGANSFLAVVVVCLSVALLRHLDLLHLLGLLHHPALLLTMMSRLLTKSTMVRRISRRAPTTTVRALLAPALTTKEDNLMDTGATAAAAVAEAVMVVEGGEDLVPTMAPLMTDRATAVIAVGTMVIMVTMALVVTTAHLTTVVSVHKAPGIESPLSGHAEALKASVQVSARLPLQRSSSRP